MVEPALLQITENKFEKRLALQCMAGCLW